MVILDQQQKRIDKLNTDEFYLIGFDGKEILMTGSTKNVYKIIIQDDCSMHCNCPDSISHAKKFNVLCKHICFIYLKICKSTDLSFFNVKKLTNNDIAKLKARTETLTFDATAKKFYTNYINKITNETNGKNALNFNESKREQNVENDDCPICFEELKENIKFCPDCSNPVHEKCIKKWLDSHNSCVYCRSDVWKNFGKKEISKNTNTEKYINLKA
jgi:hypothetical protein